MFVLNVKYPLNACFWYIMGTVMLFPFPTTCPSASNNLWQLLDVNFLHGYLLFSARLVVVLLDACVSCLAAVGVVFVLQYAAVGVMIFLEFAIPLVFSEEIFPRLRVVFWFLVTRGIATDPLLRNIRIRPQRSLNSTTS